MKICITNDDSIHGEGLLLLANWAKKLGEVTIVAPREQQSGKSHSIEFHHGHTAKTAPYTPVAAATNRIRRARCP